MKIKYNIYITIATALVMTSSIFAESNFSGDRLKSSMINYINKLISPDNSTEIEVIFSKDIDNYKFSQDNINAKFNVNEKSLRGNSFIAIEFYNNNILIKRDEFPIRIKIYANVYVAARKINRGETISENDAVTAKKDITIYKNGEIPERNSIIGTVANQNIPKDAIFTLNNIKTAQFGISKGDIVNIISRSGAVAVKLKGTALQDAEQGKKIRVQCESRSGSAAQVLEGIVESPGIVAIYN